MRTIKNVFRRKARAFLTIFGIAIGVFALVVMGAMAEKINVLVDGGVKYYADKVIVTDASAGGMYGNTPMQVSKLTEIEKVPGVARASAQIYVQLEKTTKASMGPGALIVGSDNRAEGYEKFPMKFADGGQIMPGQHRVAVVGSDLVEKTGAEVGKTIKLRGEPFTVVGILEKTFTGPDTAIQVPLADAQDLFAQDLPAAVRAKLDVRGVATQMIVYPEAGVDPEALSKTIVHDVPGVGATGPKGFEEQIVSSTRIFSAIIFGVAFISLIVGGLSVVNTMTMAVSERTREIGVRKAIGASHGAIMRQFVAESAVIGVVGGLVGLALGSLVVLGLNTAGAASGTEVFLVTTRLALGALTFALVIGIAAGFYPAWRAARLNPVAALRFE